MKKVLDRKKYRGYTLVMLEDGTTLVKHIAEESALCKMEDKYSAMNWVDAKIEQEKGE